MNTRRKPQSRDPRSRATPGVQVEAGHKAHAPLPVPQPGKHLWIMTGVWGFSDEGAKRASAGETVHLDLENLLALEGPGCLACEQLYALVSHLDCPGDPSGTIP